MLLTSCSENSYKLDLDGLEQSFQGVRSSYREGSSVSISYDLIATDTDYFFTVDGEAFSPRWDEKRGFVFEFTMPDHDVKIEVSSRNTMAYLPEVSDP